MDQYKNAREKNKNINLTGLYIIHFKFTDAAYK